LKVVSLVRRSFENTLSIQPPILALKQPAAERKEEVDDNEV